MNSEHTYPSALESCWSWSVRHLDSLAIFTMLVFVNLPVLQGGTSDYFQFSATSLSFQQSYQLLTHPFAHISWYHLLLDAIAFFSFYPSLKAGRPTARIILFIGAAAGSLLAALHDQPRILEIGFCGLSGVAHGVMGAWSLELCRNSKVPKEIRRVGYLSLIIVTGKCLWEGVTQQSFLGFAHFDLMGTPIVACHAGGLIGGLCVALIPHWANLNPPSELPSPTVSSGCDSHKT